MTIALTAAGREVRTVFAKEARHFASTVTQRVVLIDGTADSLPS